MTKGRLGVLAALVALAVVFAPSSTLAPAAPASAAGVTGAVLAPTHDAADTGRATASSRVDLEVDLLALAVVAIAPRAALRHHGVGRGNRWAGGRRPTWIRDLAGRAPPSPAW